MLNNPYQAKPSATPSTEEPKQFAAQADQSDHERHSPIQNWRSARCGSQLPSHAAPTAILVSFLIAACAYLARRPADVLRSLGRNRLLWTALASTLLGAFVTMAQAHAQNMVVPKIELGVGAAQNPKDVAVTLQILFGMTVLSLAPSILIMTTAFTRIVIVFSILRSALGTPQIPPNQVLIGLALFLTFFIMQPTFEKMNNDALQPYMASKITMPQAIDRAQKPLRGFMLRQTYTNDMAFFINLSKSPRPRTADDISLMTLTPAFITSELKTAFIIGFYIYLPFLVIDMVVASTLMSMGMMMLPPTVVSLPAKLLLFVLANGWTLLIGSLARGFR